jgi:7-cyano-7-deazaguanine synthase
LAYFLKERGDDLSLLSFNYGQRHIKEIGFAADAAQHLKVPLNVIDITTVGELLTGSSLTDNIDVPDGHYAEETMKITVVPNRNAIMLTMAYGVAVARQADVVAIGVHSGDHFIYPDCREKFILSFEMMQHYATEGFAKPGLQLFAPFINWTKVDIVDFGHHKLGVPWEKTWSCYKGGIHHCGRCGTCVERIEAFKLAKVPDPTIYREYST